MARLKNHAASYWLNDAAAAAFNRMEDEQGFINLTSAGRSVAEQNELISRWDRGGAANRPPYLYEPARPAERSNHVKNGGVAFDTTEWQRVRGFCERYGFKWYGNSDPVHFEYVGGGSAPAPAPVSGSQRVTKAVTNGRPQPNTSQAPVGEALQPGAVGNFTAWTRGESVEGNNVWFKGISDRWFWSGGFEGGANTNGLPEVGGAPAPAPAATNQRKVVAHSVANGRSAPRPGGKFKQSLAAGTVADFNGWTRGEAVEGNNVWYRGAYSGDWFWSGGFEGGANTNGLPEVSFNEAPVTPTPQPSGGAVRVTPVYPGAKEGWDTPRGREARTPNRITGFAVHHTGNTAPQENYFKGSGDGSVPTWYVDTDGSVIEFTRPGLRPVTTAANNNWTVSVEIRNSGGEAEGWPVTKEQLEAVAKLIAWVHSYNGKKLDGSDVAFEINRSTVKGHKEWPGNSTTCPGPFVTPRLDTLVARAQEIARGESTPVDPTTQPETQPETVSVNRAKLQEFNDWLTKALGR